MLIAETNELANQGLAGYQQSDGRVSNPLGTWDSDPIKASTLANTTTTELGETNVRMAELDKLAQDDVEAIAASFRGEAD